MTEPTLHSLIKFSERSPGIQGHQFYFLVMILAYKPRVQDLWCGLCTHNTLYLLGEFRFTSSIPACKEMMDG